MDWPMDLFCAALDRMSERATAGEKKSRAQIIADLKKANEERKLGSEGPWWAE
jgi:hypothetical protein